MKKLVSSLVLICALLALHSLGEAGSFVVYAQEACPTNINGYTDEQLQHFLVICEKEIADQQQVLTLTKKQADTISQIITQLKAKIKKSELEIKARNITITRLGGDIDVRKKNISVLEAKIGRTKDSVSELLRKSRELGDYSALEALLSGQDLSTFFANVDDFQSVRGKLSSLLADIEQTKEKTEGEKKALETSKTKESDLRYQQVVQKKQTENLQAQQQEVLKLTQAQAKAYQAKIAALERAKNEISNRIFRTVGGQELPFGEALKLVRMYSDKTGVAPALTLAVLSQESSVGGLIGKNIGKCTYNQSATNSEGTVMSASQKPSFLAIMSELGLNPDTTPVSCPIYSDGAYGGAMGPSQFMPATWWNVGTETGYKKRIAQVMGIAAPNPFRSLDAFTGTALYLSDGLTRCVPAFSTVFQQRACTAAKYYAGLTTSGTKLARHMNPVSSYGYQVATRAAQFDKDIAVLDQ
ncbi:MAG TPA: hypothetical protein VJG48_02645 [Candidatus Paceibacterota bacterium]